MREPAPAGQRKAPSTTDVRPAEHAPTREPLRARLLRFGRTMVVGFWANVLDFALLAVCLRWLEIAALPSRVIALVLSAALTFVGTRSFAFRVQGGNIPRQASRFVIAELVGVPLNLLSFQLCALGAPHTAPELVSFVANGLVFVLFSYPVRRLLVFGADRAALPRAGHAGSPRARLTSP